MLIAFGCASINVPFHDTEHVHMSVCPVHSFKFLHNVLHPLVTWGNCCQTFHICVYVQCCQSEPEGTLGRKWERDEAKAGDEWGGWNGNLRRSDLTWRRSWLPRGHELSLMAGVSVLFPGPLAQVRLRRRVREGNGKRNRVMFFHTYRADTRSYIRYHLSHFNIPHQTVYMLIHQVLDNVWHFSCTGSFGFWIFSFFVSWTHF